MSHSPITFVYDLYALPSTQHRAGLAGLCFVCDAMLQSGQFEAEALPDLQYEAESGLYRLTWTPESLTAVLNYLYAARLEKVEVRQKWQGAELLDTITKPNKDGKEERWFVHQQVTPSVPFFDVYQMGKEWKRLWFNALWQTLRAVPKTRIPFENRAAGKDAFDIGKLWKELSSFEKDMQNGKLRSGEVAGSLYIGSQAYNADMVSFEGRVDQNLLLHFWPVTMQIFCPQIIEQNGKTKTIGYVLVVPDVTDIEGFNEDLKNSISGLSDEMAGFRPKDALIALPQEGALMFAAQLMGIAGHEVQEKHRFSICGMDVFHLEKQGNNIKTLFSDRISLDRELVGRYQNVRNQCRNTVFRRQLILNLLADRPWYIGFEKVFSKLPKTFFIGKQYPAGQFAGDVSRRMAQSLIPVAN